MNLQTGEKMAKVAAEYWSQGLPFAEASQKRLFVATLTASILEKVRGAEERKRWRIYIESYPQRNRVDQMLQDAALAAGFHREIFLIRPAATVFVGNEGVQVSEGASDAWQPLFSVEQE
jgi:hypothetical protein